MSRPLSYPRARTESHRACMACGTSLAGRSPRAMVCSKRCSDVKRGHVLAVRLTPDTCRLPGCGETFTPNKGGQRTCSDAHAKKLWHAEHPGAQEWDDRRRDAYHRRRAQKKATADRPVLLTEIRERDKNRCHLCRKRVSVKPYPHPLSASLDHVIPLSLDGEHVPENVRLAHLRCNVSKGNGGGNEQLMLIG